MVYLTFSAIPDSNSNSVATSNQATVLYIAISLHIFSIIIAETFFREEQDIPSLFFQEQSPFHDPY